LLWTSDTHFIIPLDTLIWQFAQYNHSHHLVRQSFIHLPLILHCQSSAIAQPRRSFSSSVSHPFKDSTSQPTTRFHSFNIPIGPPSDHHFSLPIRRQESSLKQPTNNILGSFWGSAPIIPRLFCRCGPSLCAFASEIRAAKTSAIIGAAFHTSSILPPIRSRLRHSTHTAAYAGHLGLDLLPQVRHSSQACITTFAVTRGHHHRAASRRLTPCGASTRIRSPPWASRHPHACWLFPKRSLSAPLHLESAPAPPRGPPRRLALTLAASNHRPNPTRVGSV
jgi:hypothetical protein